MERELSLEFFGINAVRRNHALEHATINILAGKGYRLAGISGPLGFAILGSVPTEVLLTAAQEALDRLSEGEKELAYHENCGTNYAAMGLAAALASFLAFGGANTAGKRFRKLPDAILLASLAIIGTRRLGPWLQREVTTETSMDAVRITGIHMYESIGFIWHRISVEHNKAK